MSLPPLSKQPQAAPDSAAQQTPPHAPGYAAGDVIANKYQLTQPLGEGAMGKVWLARNRTLDVDVAIKLVRAEIGGREATARLLREARAAAQLKHPSTVRIFDFGETHRGDPFIVMELLGGELLGQLLAREGSLGATYAVQLLLPICGALAEAHEAHIVHRDVKPDNIIIVTDRNATTLPKLVDFGIAKQAGLARMSLAPDVLPDAGEGQRPQPSAMLTQMGSLLGSPAYMSPEQARGDRSVDKRADVWALSVVMYQAIAGRCPFEDDDTEQLLLAILAQDPPSLAERARCDEQLWQIIARGLCRDRTERWQSAREMGRALARWLHAQGLDVDISGASVRQHWLRDETAASMAPPAMAELPVQRSKRGLLVAVVLLAVVAMGIGFGFMLLVRDPAPVAVPSPSPDNSSPTIALSSSPAHASNPANAGTQAPSVDASNDVRQPPSTTPRPRNTNAPQPLPWKRPAPPPAVSTPPPAVPSAAPDAPAPRPIPSKDLGF